MAGYWKFTTRKGTFTIVLKDDGVLLKFEGETLGPYKTAAQAAEEAAGGHCGWPSTWDPADLSIPDDLSLWTFVRAP